MNYEATTGSRPEHMVEFARPASIWKKSFRWISHITVEPTMWFYMMAFMITSVIEQAFFVYKACRVDHKLPEDICRNLKDHDDLKVEVQLTVSEFHQWNNIAGHVVPIILALFFGNWSDRRGRKTPLLFGLIGKLVYSLMIVVNSSMENWNLNMIIYTASLPMGMLGGDVAIFAACFSYISDITSVEQRTLRITILDVAYLSTMPTGVALGSYLYNGVFDKSYTIMFILNSTLLALSIVYSYLRLDWQTSEKQKPLSNRNFLIDFFDKVHVVETVKTLSKKRRNHGRLHLWILLIAMMLYTFQRDEKPMSFLYTQLVFKWSERDFSQFRTYQSALYVVATLIGIPLMSKLLKMNDSFIVAVGAFSHAMGRIAFILAKVSKVFYVGVILAALGPVVAPVLRSLTSKVVPIEERGKVFSMLSVCDNAVPLFSGVLYSQLYNSTINTAPYSIYCLTFVTQIAVLLLIMIMHFSTRAEEDVNADNSDNTSETQSSVVLRAASPCGTENGNSIFEVR